jgi:hypothetical protein
MSSIRTNKDPQSFFKTICHEYLENLYGDFVMETSH